MRAFPLYWSPQMFYPGQRVIARDGAQYVLAFERRGQWFGQRAGSPVPWPVTPRYPAWGGDDERAEADYASRRAIRGDTSRGLSRLPQGSILT